MNLRAEIAATKTRNSCLIFSSWFLQINCSHNSKTRKQLFALTIARKLQPRKRENSCLVFFQFEFKKIEPSPGNCSHESENTAVCFFFFNSNCKNNSNHRERMAAAKTRKELFLFLSIASGKIAATKTRVRCLL